MKLTGTETETFYIIGTESGYWHWTDSGSRIDCWGEPLTAERFDTEKEAEKCIDEEYDPDIDGDRPKVLKVTQTVEVTETQEDELGDDSGYCGTCRHCDGVDDENDVCICRKCNAHADWRNNPNNEKCPEWEA